jgi:hypothetical protein
MISAFVLYESAPDPERYAAHVRLCRDVPASEFVHGPVTGAASGKPRYAYFAEFRFGDRASFKNVMAGPEFAATGEDAVAMGVPFSVHFASLD